MYLLDTNVLSLLAPQSGRSEIDVSIAKWLQRVPERIFFSVITIAEIETGIQRLERNGAHAKAGRFAGWLSDIIEFHHDHVLTIDVDTARLAGRLYDQALGRGGNAGFPDALIAATANRSGFKVITRNSRHFGLFDTTFINPYDGIPVND